MPLALILSSFVAASRIGGAAQQYILAAHKIDPVLAPTVMFGRTPARGGKGEVTSPDVFRRMLGDIEADALFGMVDLIITGHFSDPEQVEIAAGVIERVRTTGRSEAWGARPLVLVDPVLGDAPRGLYVKYEVAQAVQDRLVPLADWLTPNLWELAFLADRQIDTAADARDAVRSLGKPALVTSAPAGDGEIGLLYVDKEEAVLFGHRRIATAPNGTGDLVTASFGAGLVEGRDPRDAAERAARAAAETVAAAEAWKSTELPIVALAERIVNPAAPVRVERL
ncbi:PfkB family carbohydrate kinase [Phenylobacterium sp.]|uniref:PfkB family carbohydrate kinase n=1 Tax=Phenylobacterium sp. TaxID=1871053 RepID=UPI0025D85978|nr:PfkB family carbohydrate kinase [Phenylobacterium sp.]MBX3484531.1 bifunctional hydroxymethylpyrimidine kinase/phosphomethylpyrimidine kinase [Phenylobacterium sp.]MCW5759765.1 bifunctional hydroxymethylpyrimidine kinase/phosphomethylpyrimidine kinase [Phenylobacterium sp.]